MEPSILKSIKQVVGIGDGDPSFDLDILMFTNAALATLNQIGVGPKDGFQIEDDTATWDSLLGGDPRLNNVKMYVALKVRLAFDPPPTSFAIKAVEDQAKELETRIYLMAEAELWR